jgi:hypothetical protein
VQVFLSKLDPFSTLTSPKEAQADRIALQGQLARLKRAHAEKLKDPPTVRSWSAADVAVPMMLVGWVNSPRGVNGNLGHPGGNAVFVVPKQGVDVAERVLYRQVRFSNEVGGWQLQPGDHAPQYTLGTFLKPTLSQGINRYPVSWEVA